MAATRLPPPGFQFHPTDIELVKYYLKSKVTGRKFQFEAIAEVDIYKYAPWDLPYKSCLRSGDLKWYFFCPREKKYAKGARMNRATEFGYWKTVGKDKPVQYNEAVVGMKKTLVFHRGRAPRGDLTDWVMDEYRLEDKDLADRGVAQDKYVLCMIYCARAVPVAGVSAPVLQINPDSMCVGSSSLSCASKILPFTSVPVNNVASMETPHIGDGDDGTLALSDILPSVCDVIPQVPYNNAAYMGTSHSENEDDDILPPLDTFSEEASDFEDEDDAIFALLDMFLEDTPLLENEEDDTLPLLDMYSEEEDNLFGAF